jgi:hypothetical protein
MVGTRPGSRVKENSMKFSGCYRSTKACDTERSARVRPRSEVRINRVS